MELAELGGNAASELGYLWQKLASNHFSSLSLSLSPPFPSWGLIVLITPQSCDAYSPPLSGGGGGVIGLAKPPLPAPASNLHLAGQQVAKQVFGHSQVFSLSPFWSSELWPLRVPSNARNSQVSLGPNGKNLDAANGGGGIALRVQSCSPSRTCRPNQRQLEDEEQERRNWWPPNRRHWNQSVLALVLALAFALAAHAGRRAGQLRAPAPLN